MLPQRTDPQIGLLFGNEMEAASVGPEILKETCVRGLVKRLRARYDSHGLKVTPKRDQRPGGGYAPGQTPTI